MAGRLTGGLTAQRILGHDAILIVRDVWTGAAVGVKQQCVQPIGGSLSCSPPSTSPGTFTVTAPSSTSGTFSFGVGALNCGACYVRYTYTAR